MDFSLTDEQELLLESVREFCERYFTEAVIKDMYENHTMPDEIAEAYRDAGFGLMGIPEEYGGIPADKQTLGLMIEELYHSSGCNHILYQNSLTMLDIVEFGTPEQIQMCVDAYMETGWPLCSLAISEPGAGSDNRSMTCTAKKQEDGTYVLNGQKTWVTMGERLPYTIVVAKDEDPSRENGSMSLWLIKTDRPGVSTASLHKIGQQCIPFCEMYFDDVVLTEEDRVGAPGDGFKLLMKNFEIERAFLVAEQLGLAQAALEDAAVYANQRLAFGKPIANFQMTQEKLTEMEIRVQNTRNMLYKTLWELDNDIPVQLDSALLKRYGCTELFNVADMALSIFGGIGYTTEVRIGRIWADMRGNMFGGGTPEIMAYIAGRQVAKKYAK
ncbi:MAG: acyl-CoA dehydrogenase family protein [Berryella intestinalis]|uniref:acyl-CoA dehydrogenase family protein n=1 Tax=Berryella intestinalis TaxID=1531429 RepID=UPI002A50C940|nr:acyl-CoA dehydrogenase family protein [Berryella intestinalis]MDD7368423.1 acyl-CoA dehydrogenase family protein [Berryella intestinalis]MDY3128535.1 acyl-CoA dehydrogenase family protein [Berryella intestinalis]